MGLGDAYGRSKIGRLHKHRIFQLLLHLARDLLWIFFPLAAQQSYMLDDGKAGGRKKPLHDVLVHSRRRSQNTRPDVGNVRQLQQTLNCPIFTEGAMQHREDDVHADAVLVTPTFAFKGNQRV